jgi:hypothetical protein
MPHEPDLVRFRFGFRFRFRIYDWGFSCRGLPGVLATNDELAWSRVVLFSVYLPHAHGVVRLGRALKKRP